MVYLGGGKFIEVGYVNEGRVIYIEEVIFENIVVIFYVKFYYIV